VSGDTINLTVVEEVAQISITLEEQAPITINFLDVATVDPRVAQALLDAQAAQAAAEVAQAAAEAAVVSVSAASLVNALIFG
jgi:hypothetical protein